MRKYQQIVNLLESLKLKGMIPNLDNEITEAEEKKVSYVIKDSGHFLPASLSPPSSFSFLCAQVIKKRKKG